MVVSGTRIYFFESGWPMLGEKGEGRGGDKNTVILIVVLPGFENGERF